MATGPKKKEKSLDGDLFSKGRIPPMLSFAHVYIPFCFTMGEGRLERGSIWRFVQLLCMMYARVDLLSSCA